MTTTNKKTKQLTLEETLQQFIEKSKTLFARLTLNVTKEEILEKLKTKYSQIIVSEENDAERLHFHVLVLHADTNTKNARQNFRNFLKESFPQMKGNSDYSITKTVEGTTARLAAYVIKEHNYVQYGFDESFMKALVKMSYKKYDGKKFTDRMNEIDEKWYMDKRSDIEGWVNLYIQLKVEFNQSINPRVILPMMHLRQAKKFGIEEITGRIMAEFNRV